MKVSISIAMTVYNGEKFLVNQLDSLLTQSLPAREIIIVNDCSTDKSLEIIEIYKKNYPNISIFNNVKNLGPILSFKKAVSLCIGDYIALCDQDDIWDIRKLELGISDLMATENINLPSIIFTDLKLIDSYSHPYHNSFWALQGYDPAKFTFKELLIGNIVTGCTVILNKVMQLEINRMPATVYMHDHWIALIAFGFGRFTYSYNSQINYRIHNNSVTKKSKLSFYDRFKLFVETMIDFKGHYLKKNIEQAIRFNEFYGHKLSLKNKNELVRFVGLRKNSSFTRKIKVGFWKYLNN